MLSINEIKQGSIIKIDNEPYIVLQTQHFKMGRGGAILKIRIKNLITGNVLEKTLKGSDQVEGAELERKKAQYLYPEGDNYNFMESECYEQFSIEKEILAGKENFIKEGTQVDVLYFEGKPVNIDIPKKVDLKIVEAPEGVRGDSSQGRVTKTAVTETGYQVNVPLFINEGDIIKINTETGEYVERV